MEDGAGAERRTPVREELALGGWAEGGGARRRLSPAGAGTGAAAAAECEL